MPSKCEMKNMDDKRHYLYEYAVVNYVPNLERGEFINIGLVMMCKRARWIKTGFAIDESRIRALFQGADLDVLKDQIVGFVRVAHADKKEGGPISELEPHERFRWLTAVRSTSLQTSRPHSGLTDDLDNTFKVLFEAMVL